MKNGGLMRFTVTNKHGDFNGIYPLVNIQKAIEHGHRNSGFIYPLKVVIFHSYVSLPEGTLN